MSRRSSNAGDVFCPSHPDVMLMRQKQGMFGRKMQVVNDECPRCRDGWPTYQSPTPGSFADGYHAHQVEEGFQPSAPYDDHTVASFSPGRTTAVRHHTHENTPTPNITTATDSGGGSFSLNSQNQAEHDNFDLAQNIMDMVHSLLDRENPARGPGFVVDQLEMLCAWSLGDPNVRTLIVDAGGIYILVNLLQNCHQTLGARPTVPSSSVTRVATESRSIAAVSRGPAGPAVGGEATAATEAIDDATTIATNFEIDDMNEQFASMDDGLSFGVQQHPSAPAVAPRPPVPPAPPVTSPSAHRTSHGTGHMPAQHQPQRIAPAAHHATSYATRTSSVSRSPGFGSLSYPGSYFAPPTTRSVAFPEPSFKAPPSDASIASNPFANVQWEQSTSDDVSLPRCYGFHAHHSPPPPTMNDIDKAFGHLFGPSSSSTVGGSTADPGRGRRPAYSVSTPMIPETVATDVSDAASCAQSTVAYSVSSRRAPSVSGSSVSAYIAPRTPSARNERTVASRPNSEADRAVKEARWIVATLANLSQDESSVDVLRSAGGIEILLTTLWRLEEDEMIQDCGCECLSTLASSEGSVYVRGLIASFGGVATVLRSMKLFPATPTLQHKCCIFISKMVAGDPVVLQTVVTLRGIELITLSMRLHGLDVKLQEVACLALETLMTEGDNLHSLVVESRGAEAVLTAMWQFEGNCLIQQYGCSALGCMCSNHIGNKYALAESGAVETILSAMRAHNQNVYIIRAAFSSLLELTDNCGTAMQHALDDDAISTIRQAAPNDPERAKVLRLRLYHHRSTVFKPA